jgi:hypothetical protein
MATLALQKGADCCGERSRPQIAISKNVYQTNAVHKRIGRHFFIFHTALFHQPNEELTTAFL